MSLFVEVYWQERMVKRSHEKPGGAPVLVECEARMIKAQCGASSELRTSGRAIITHKEER